MMRRRSLQSCFDYTAHPTWIQGNIIETSLLAAAIGEVREVQSSINDTSLTERRPIDSETLHFTKRRPIAEKLVTRIRSIDGLLTCGHGQHLGIFAVVDEYAD